MTVLLAHPLPNPFSRAVARALAREGLLDRLVTTLAVPETLATARWLPRALRVQLQRRLFDGVPWRSIRAAPVREVVRLGSRALRADTLLQHEKGWASVDALFRSVAAVAASELGRRRVGAVYAYEDGALEIFRAAKRHEVCCIYDLPIAHWRTVHRILAEERELEPEWADTLEALKDSPAKLARKDAELALADHVVVASRFTEASVRAAGRMDVPVHVIPYGAPLPPLEHPAERRPDEPLRIVYVGHLRQRKGIAYLLKAVRRLAIPHELTLIGPGPAEPSAHFREAVGRHRWLGTMPHPRVLEVLRTQHVMVFPSLAEGFGLVILEAMGCGVPVITTPNTGGPEVMTDGVDGFIVPIRDPDAIAASLTELYEDEPRRRAMAEAARRTAERFSWARYEAAIVRTVREILGVAA